MGKIKDLPVLGNINLPVRLMHYDNKENNEKRFHSGFAYWWAADGSSDVLDDEGNEIGMIGGKMGGHVEMVRYYPHNGQPHESEKYKQSITAIIDVRDIWAQIEELLESENVKVQLEGMEEVQRKYQEIEKKMTEIKQMQDAAEKEEKRKKSEEEEAKNPYKNIGDGFKQCKKCHNVLYNHQECNCKNQKEEEPKAHQNPIITISNGTTYEILKNPNGWDLNETIRGRDVEFYDEKEKPNNPNRTKDGRIPLNIGCDVKLKKGDEILYTDDKPDSFRKNEVTLKVSTWCGISSGAIHYYGSLKFNTPSFHPEGKPDTSTSCWLNLFNGGEIELTRILEKWEFEKYPDVYEDWYVGDNYRGFYNPEDVIKAGKKVFNDFFEKGWKLKIDKCY